jgi:protein SCO1/2
VTLAALRGKVVAVTFIYTSCPDVCPMLTDKMARIQDELGSDFGSKVAFVSITTDPERDTPEVLKGYAEAFDANLAGWSFLTGEPATVLDVAHRYGVAVVKAADGGVDHTLLTTLIDPQGTMRVQYLGYRFDEEEFRHDLQSLMNEP